MTLQQNDTSAHVGSRSVYYAEASQRHFGALSVFAGASSFIALIQLCCLGLGVLGIQLNHFRAIIVIILSLILSLLFATRFREASIEDSGVFPPSGWFARTFNAALKAICFVVIVWAGWVWIELWILASLRPPYDWDGLYYHIPAIHQWVQAGRVLWIEGVRDVPYINFPMGVEACTFLMHKAVRTSRFVNACNLWYWPLAVSALAVIAARLGARGVWKWLAGGLIIGVPAFLSQSVSCYIDPGFSSTVMASIAASSVFVFDEERPLFWKSVLLGANVGLMAGSKGTGLPFALTLLAVVLVAIFFVHRFRRGRRWFFGGALCVLVAFIIGGYWYARNTIITGNPIHPMELRFGKRVIIEGYDYIGLNEANIPPWLEKYPPWSRMFVSWLQLDAPISGYAPIGGMGYIWIGGALPAFLYLWVIFLWRRRHHPLPEFAFLTALLFVLLIVQPSPWWARFTLWLHALGLPCVAVALYHAVSRWHLMKRYLVAVVLGLGVLSVAVWESHTTLEIEWKHGRNPRAKWDSEMYMTSQQYWFPEMEDIPGFDEFFNARKIARSQWSEIGTLLGGVLAMPLDQREILMLPERLEKSDIESLRNEGVEWIVWDVLGAGDVPDFLRRAAKEERAYHPAPDAHFRIIQLR